MSAWIAVADQLPENQVPVLVVGEPDRYKMRVRMVAYYIRKRTLSADYYEDEVGDADYDEATDLYYTPEGWYEVCHGNEFNPRFSGTVTHWMTLPAMPEVQP